MKRFDKKLIVVFLPLCLAVLLFGLYAFRYFSNRNTIDSIKESVQLVEESHERTVSDSNSALSSALYDVSGFDAVRYRRDNETAKVFFESLFNWSNEDEYRKARDYLIENLGSDGASQLLENMFLDIPVVTDSAGNVYSDLGLSVNMAFESMDTYPISIDGDVYRYIACVFVSSVKDGSYTGIGDCFFTYSVDENGKISDVKGYTSYDP